MSLGTGPGEREVRYIGIDYSGAATATSGLPGLRVFEALGGSEPAEARPAALASRHWSRKAAAQWLASRLAEDVQAIVGIDHGFSFPEAYFERHGMTRDWDVFLDDFCAHWPTGAEDVSVRAVRQGLAGTAASRPGDSRWRRLCERRMRGTKSVFHFDVQGQVATSTHAGLPWLRGLRRSARHVHFWPFDGWIPSEGASVVAEVFPSLWRARYPAEGRTADQQDAYAVCRWLQACHSSGQWGRCLNPELTAAERRTAGFEGWILGVP